MEKEIIPSEIHAIDFVLISFLFLSCVGDQLP